MTKDHRSAHALVRFPALNPQQSLFKLYLWVKDKDIIKRTFFWTKNYVFNKREENLTYFILSHPRFGNERQPATNILLLANNKL